MSSAPIQFRAIVNEGDRTLQFRHAFAVDASGAFCPGPWTEWEKVEEWDFLAACRADAAERRELRIRQAQAIFGMTPQPCHED
jgi:hypothetical protein